MKGKIIRHCEICRKEFRTHPYLVKRGYGKFCSRKCKGIGTAGRRVKDNKKCLICGKSFYAPPCLFKTHRFCSHGCRRLGLKGKPAWNKGLRAWKEWRKKNSEAKKKDKKNTARLIAMNKSRIGIPLKPEHAKKVGDILRQWDRSETEYRNLHKKIQRWLGTPDTCTQCGKSGLIGKQIHWANKSGKYLKTKNDWIRLCQQCHILYDKNLRNYHP